MFTSEIACKISQTKQFEKLKKNFLVKRTLIMFFTTSKNIFTMRVTKRKRKKTQVLAGISQQPPQQPALDQKRNQKRN